VLSCPEPAGVISPGSCARVPLLFHPLEAREYFISLPLRFGHARGGPCKDTTVLIRANGYDPSDAPVDSTSEAGVMPPCSLLQPSQVGLPVSLSLDTCVFGRLPQHSDGSQFLILSNALDTACKFAWDTAHPLYGSRVAIHPSGGSVPPLGHVCCKVCVRGAGPPEALDLVLGCTLEPLASTAANDFTRTADGTRKLVAERPEQRRERSALTPLAARQSLAPPLSSAAPPRLLLGVRATFLPSATLRSAAFPLAEHFVPRSLPPPEPTQLGRSKPRRSQAGIYGAGVARDAATRRAQRDTAEAVLVELLQDVMRSEEVRRVLQAPPVRIVPWFAQLAFARHGTAPAPVTVRCADATCEVGVLDDAAAAEERKQERAFAAAEAARRTTRRLRDVQSSAELQELAAYVLEGTLFSLVSDASHGELSLLDQTPTAPTAEPGRTRVTKAFVRRGRGLGDTQEW